MNLQKIKDDISWVINEFKRGTNLEYAPNRIIVLRKIEEALAEFEKPLDDAYDVLRKLQRTVMTLSNLDVNDQQMVDLAKERDEKRAAIIQQYAEAYHQRKCEECKKETAERKESLRNHSVAVCLTCPNECPTDCPLDKEELVEQSRKVFIRDIIKSMIQEEVKSHLDKIQEENVIDRIENTCPYCGAYPIMRVASFTLPTTASPSECIPVCSVCRKGSAVYAK